MANTEAVRQATELLVKGVDEVFTSWRFAEYLDVMSRFHHYSASNCILIMMQCPEATHVASYNKWRNDFNRQVRKGERGIRILAPIQHKSTIRETDKATGKVEEHEHVWLTFKTVPVFDISQTDGDDLPEIATDLIGSVDDFESLCQKVTEATTAKVMWNAEFSDPECHGSFDRVENVIRIKGGMSEAQTIKTLVHETAHSILHGEGGEQGAADKGIREVQAEGVAFVVCNALGIHTDGYSFGYIAGWSDWGEDHKAVLSELEVIRKTANAILDKVA